MTSCRNAALLLGGSWAAIADDDWPRKTLDCELLVLSGWHERYDALLAQRDGPTVVRWHSALLQTELSNETWKLARVVGLLESGRIPALAANDPAVVRSLGRAVVFLPDVLDRSEYAAVRGLTLPGTNVSLFGEAHHRKNLLCQSAAFAVASRAAGDAWTLHLNGQSERLPDLACWLESAGVRFHEHGFLAREAYLALVAGMDAGLSATLSESYGYVAADHLELGVPVVMPAGLPCADAGQLAVADPGNVEQIADRLTLALTRPELAAAARASLLERARVNLERAEVALRELRARAARSG